MRTLIAIMALFCAATMAFAAVGDKPAQVTTPVTLTGTLKLLDAPQERGEVGAQLVSGDAVYRLMLAPAAYLEKIDAKLTDGAQATVIGWQVGDNERKAAVIVGTLLVGDAKYTLRDEKGNPVWTPISIAPQTTVIGTIKAVNARRAEVLVTLSTNAGDLQVTLAPAAYIVEQGIAIPVGEQLTVSGWQVGEKKRSTVSAQTITIGGKTLAMRDADGKPLWETAQLKKDRPAAEGKARPEGDRK